MSDEKKVGIYRIVCKGKNYIGQSRDIERRFADHKSVYKHSRMQSPLYSDMRKYGLKAFNFEILLECDSSVTNDKLDEYEARYIRAYDSIKKGYNRRPGGSTSSPTLEQRMKTSRTMMGHPCSEETKRKIGKGNERAVICITTGEVFPSVKEAMAVYGNEPHNQLFCGIKSSRSGLRFERYKEKSMS